MNNIKFSIIIPTHNRPELLAVVVKHAMQLDYPSFEVIVSDNSSEETMRRNNDEVVSEYLSQDNFRIVRPPQLLSPPEHFEFALDFASGDYVLYLTDKMMILPHILSLVAEAISASGAEIVNWATTAHQIDDAKTPAGSGTLTVSSEFLEGRPELYDPQAALSFKASCVVPRDKQQSKDYIIGKIIFGCYSKELIKRIRGKTGTVFNGATHDYSAMIQALSLAKSCVMLNTYGAIFITLPPDESWGSLINTYAQQALNYYKSFKDAQSILDSLMIPGLYASQHNMVAHDYKKFLPLYGNANLFNERNWLLAIYTDLVSPSKVWRDAKEKKDQLRLFFSQIKMTTHFLLYVLYKWSHLVQLRNRLISRYRLISLRLTSRSIEPPKPQVICQTFHMKTLADAVQHILLNIGSRK